MKLFARLLFIAGLGALLIGGFDAWLVLRGTREPEVTTAVSLGSVNGTKNVHVTVTNFKYGEGMVVEEDDKGNWKRIWIPILSPDDEWTPRPIVVHTKKVPNQGALEEWLKQDKITGVVTNGMQGLGSNQQKEFAAHYPGANLSGAIAIEDGRRFPSPYIAFPVAIAGLVGVVVGLRLVFRSN